MKINRENNNADFRDIHVSPEFPVRYHHLSNWYEDALKWLNVGSAKDIKLQSPIPAEKLPWNMSSSPETDQQFLDFAKEVSTAHAEYYIERWGNAEIVKDKLSEILESATLLSESEPHTYNAMILSFRDVLISSGHASSGPYSMGAITYEHREELANLIEERSPVLELEEFCSEVKSDYEAYIDPDNKSEVNEKEKEDLEALKQEIAMFKESSTALIETIKNSNDPERVQALISQLMFLVNHKHFKLNMAYSGEIETALGQPEKSLEIFQEAEKAGRADLHYIADLYGENPSLSSEATVRTIQNNIDNKNRFLKLAQSNPEAKIQVSGDPDLICAACSGGKEFGEHCTQRLDEGEVGADLVTKNILAKLYSTPPAYLNLRDEVTTSHKSNGNLMFEIPVRLLFDQKFIFAMEKENNSYYREMHEANKKSKAVDSN